MSFVKVKLLNGGAVARAIRSYEKRKVRMLGAAIQSGGRIILADALERVPRDTGALAATGRVEPLTTVGGIVETAVAFGGPGVDYAIDVHEDPAQPNRKYLEIAEKGNRKAVLREIRSEVQD